MDEQKFLEKQQIKREKKIKKIFVDAGKMAIGSAVLFMISFIADGFVDADKVDAFQWIMVKYAALMMAHVVLVFVVFATAKDYLIAVYNFGVLFYLPGIGIFMLIELYGLFTGEAATDLIPQAVFEDSNDTNILNENLTEESSDDDYNDFYRIDSE